MRRNRGGGSAGEGEAREAKWSNGTKNGDRGESGGEWDVRCVCVGSMGPHSAYAYQTRKQQNNRR